VRCFIIIINAFRLCATLDNRVHDICGKTGLKRATKRRWSNSLLLRESLSLCRNDTCQTSIATRALYRMFACMHMHVGPACSVLTREKTCNSLPHIVFPAPPAPGQLLNKSTSIYLSSPFPTAQHKRHRTTLLIAPGDKFFRSHSSRPRSTDRAEGSG
jgi:hypothetical protein